MSKLAAGIVNATFGSRRLFGTAVTLVAVIVSFTVVYAVCRWFGAGTEPSIVAAILTISLSRRAQPAHGVNALLLPAMLVGVALVSAGVGVLLRTIPVAGAAVFVGGMFLSVWLRNFGERGRRAGPLIALPLVTMLLIPPPRPAPGGLLVTLGLLAFAGLTAFASVALSRRLTERGAARATPVPEKPAAAVRTGMTPATKMALQMAVATAAGFGAGFTLFPGHWGWTVLTAFIVCSGALGRSDAVYKGVLRLLGALAGTVAAAVLAHVWRPQGVAEAVTIFVVLYLGLLLRETNYAYWAACTTLVLALLAGTGDGSGIGLLGVRLLAILAGAICAVAATWLVFPISTEAIVRRRLADLLLALDELVTHAHRSEIDRAVKLAAVDDRATELDRTAPPLEWHRRIFARGDAHHPAVWIAVARNVRREAQAFVMRESGEAHRGKLRRAIGVSRRAIAHHTAPPAEGEPIPIADALATLHETFAKAD